MLRITIQGGTQPKDGKTVWIKTLRYVTSGQNMRVGIDDLDSMTFQNFDASAILGK